MKHRIALCVGLTMLGVAAATSAQAQGIYIGPPRFYGPPPAAYDAGLAPGEVLMRVRAAGLSPLTQPARRGPHYLLLASDRMGGQLRVVVSSFDGRIVRVTPAYDPRFAYHPVRPQAVVPVPPARYGATRGPEVKDPSPVARAPRPAVPPAQAGTASDPRLASAPANTETVPSRPARTPLPRPRPAAASNEAAAPAAAQASAPAAAAPLAARPQPAAKSAPATIRKAPPATPTELVPVAPLE